MFESNVVMVFCDRYKLFVFLVLNGLRPDNAAKWCSCHRVATTGQGKAYLVCDGRYKVVKHREQLTRQWTECGRKDNGLLKPEAKYWSLHYKQWLFQKSNIPVPQHRK